ncbi:hypothetical protein FVEN_g1421 [Fusarium venenatum]|uniref:Uncharacterized protein n=1 Tax=Fusarium venenatum TaxID=56646 RepID=A0A2L2T5L4_9HYPO|nr:uncharacterized protein FVRRES_13380 [Fusarium venenatum]KAG8360833.1 hypothetical protein FVEN_g1421 [Fusarium venenatum]KAH6979921.1 hypothetical protein EDB82DRAFT_527986 [Fusarium venenatum]CEI41013.1 unnamed protein product [Fusarium venenatum]
MRTLNTINSSSSRPTSPGLSVSQPRTRRPLTPSANDKLVTSSKPLPKTRSQATGKTQVQAQAQAQARPRFSSAGNRRTSPSLGFHNPNQQHVLSVTATITSTRSTSSSSAPPTTKMAPSESRHRPPQLSASAAKTVGRTPLTPKIASTPKGPALGAPPLVRRSTQGLSAVASHRDETAITPRSGSRQSRNNSNTTTPSGTPNLDQESWNPRNSLTSIGRLSRAESPADPDAKFFRASDAPTSSQPSGRPSISSQKSNNFFHASKATSEFKKATSPSAAPYTSASNAAPEPLASKFFYANGVDLDLKPTSANASSSRLQSKRPSTSSSTNNSNNSQPSRPHSPTKNPQPNPSILKNAGAPGLSGRPQVVSPLQIASPPPLAPAASITAKRRVSIESPPKKQRGHARAGSVPNFDHANSPRLPMSPARRQHELSPPSSPGTIQPALTMASILQMAEDISDEEEENEEKDTQDNESQPDLQSPTKSSHGEPVNDLVANARRERKVQDLQITNASLEAINRTLERQMRKQQAEIRRFRRLSRSGRLSAVASAASSRVTSAALTDVPISLSDLSEEENSEPPSEDEDSLDESDMSTDSISAPLDPNDEKAMEKAMARRKRDEDRLQLDLSKHRDILVDSQKINQSIKRCLNWTEVLIKEGQKALEYKVRVTDVELVGQILPPLNDDEDDDLSEIDDFGTDPGSPVDEPPLPWEKSSQDRDSGIELQPDSS